MPVGVVTAAIAGVGAVASAGIGAYSASQAAKAQKKASKKALKAQEAAAAQARSDLQPWRATGEKALTSLADMYGLGEGDQNAFSDTALANFYKSPDYRVALEQGVSALDNSAASKGNLLSGGQIKGVMEYGSDLATLKFNNYISRLSQLSGAGQSAASGQASVAQNAGNNAANNYNNIGAAEASGIVGTGNAISGGIDAATKALVSGLGTAYGSGGYSSNPTYASDLSNYYNDYT